MNTDLQLLEDEQLLNLRVVFHRSNGRYPTAEEVNEIKQSNARKMDANLSEKEQIIQLYTFHKSRGFDVFELPDDHRNLYELKLRAQLRNWLGKDVTEEELTRYAMDRVKRYCQENGISIKDLSKNQIAEIGYDTPEKEEEKPKPKQRTEPKKFDRVMESLAPTPVAAKPQPATATAAASLSLAPKPIAAKPQLALGEETRVIFQITHTVSHLSPNERYPTIKCYLDRRWERESVEVQLTREKMQTVTIRGMLPREITSLPPTAGIGFASFAWRPNESGNMCKMDAGVTEVYFSDILRGLKESKDGKYTKELELTMNTVQYYKKGAIRVSFTRDGIHGLPEYVYDTVSAHIGEQLTDYVNGNMQLENEMEDLIEGTAQMRIPYNYSEIGMKCTNGAPLPAASYVLAEIPKTNDLYWENAFKVCMRRVGMKPEEWNRLSIEGKADMACKTVCYLPQYMDYIGDTVDKNKPGSAFQRSLVIPCENFGDALATISGDCEDVASAISQLKNALCRHSFSQRSECYKQLTEIQSIMSRYVNPLSLDVVRGAQVNRVASVGAHMNDNFIPIELFEKWIGARNPERVSERVPPPASRAAGKRGGGKRGGENASNALRVSERVPVAREAGGGTRGGDSGLPFMIGEGTGMYMPYSSTPLAIANAPIARYVFGNTPSMEGFKKPLEHKAREIGNFFIGSLVGMTDYYYQKGSNAPMSFWYTTNGKRGATYDDMINHPERVSIKMQPTIGSQLMQHVEEAIALRVPPDPVILTEAGMKHRKNKHLDRVCASVNGMRRAPGSEDSHVCVYIRPHQIGVKVADAMIHDFSRLDRVWKLEYHTEPITDAVWGFQLQIYVK